MANYIYIDEELGGLFLDSMSSKGWPYNSSKVTNVEIDLKGKTYIVDFVKQGNHWKVLQASIKK